MKSALLLCFVSFALGAVIPYFQNFENGAANWTASAILQNYPANNWALGNPNKKNGAFTGAHSGVNAWVTGLTFDYDADQHSGLFSPVFDFTNVTGNISLSFWAKWSFESNAGSFFDGVNVEYKIGTAAWGILGVDGEPGNWYNAGGVDGLEGPGWGDKSGPDINNYIFVFHLLPASMNGKPSVQFRFVMGSDSSQGDAGFAMDDFAIRPVTVPSCPTIVSPANGAAVNPVFVLNWNPNPNDLIVDYLVYAGASPTPSGYTPITGNTASGIFTGTFYWQVIPRTLLNLTATNCSVQSAVVIPPVSVPYANNFESGPANWTSVADFQSWVLGTPNKTVIRGAVSGVNAWVTGSLSQDYLESSVMLLYSPLIDFTAITNQTASYVAFKMWRESEPDYDGVILQYTVDLGRNWFILGTTGEPTNWYNGPVDIFGGVPGWSGSSSEYLSTSHLLPPNVNGRLVLFRFIFASDSNVNFNGFAIDDFAITTGTQVAPQCVVSASPTSGLTLGSPVILTWQQNSSDTSVSGFKLYISTTNNFTGISPIEVTGPSRYVTNILRSGTYFWKVVPYNLIAGDAAGCRVFNFTVAENAASFPYSENFEQGQGGWVSGGVASTWAFGTPNKTLTRSAASGTNCWINGGLTGTYASDEVSWVQSPLLNFTSVASAFLSLSTIYKTEEKFDGAVVQITTLTTPWQTLGVLGSGANWYSCPDVVSIGRVNAGQNAWCNTSSTWMVSSYALPSNLGLFKLRVLFASDSSNNYDGFGFDDVSITAQAPTQPATSAAATSAVATSAATSVAATSANVPTSAPTSPLTVPSVSETQISGSETLKALACLVSLAVLVVM